MQSFQSEVKFSMYGRRTPISNPSKDAFVSIEKPIGKV